ncbi:MAG: hypothetical protein JSR63_05745 [Proteobacteria bacterium]|nr:hypothetical protein [Pseudomonadota bacterium]MBS0217667.1 hypothetical protein [Pseudomonadota bacterium]
MAIEVRALSRKSGVAMPEMASSRKIFSIRFNRRCGLAKVAAKNASACSSNRHERNAEKIST